MSGIDLAKAVRSLPFSKDIQILMHSCLPKTKVRETFDECNGFVRKPITGDDFIRPIVFHDASEEDEIASNRSVPLALKFPATALHCSATGLSIPMDMFSMGSLPIGVQLSAQ